MELLMMLVTLFIAIIGAWISGFQMCNIKHAKLVGTLRVDNSDPDGPYLFLELNTDPRAIVQHKHVTLNVDAESYISQK